MYCRIQVIVVVSTRRAADPLSSRLSVGEPSEGVRPNRPDTPHDGRGALLSNEVIARLIDFEMKNLT